MENKQKWKFTQVFGDKFSADKVANEDIISVISFDSQGNYLAVGDRAGRLILFQRNLHTRSKTPFNEFVYLTEIQSHFKEFDCLQSVDIDEKINCIEWISQPDEALMLLTSNDKTIKFWKIQNKLVKKAEKVNKNISQKSVLKIPKMKPIDKSFCPSLKRVFPNLHTYHIHSLSLCKDQITFLSSDDLGVFLWDLENNKNSFSLVNIKPASMNELNEVITVSKFSTHQDTLFGYGTSKGLLKLYDIRESSKAEKGIIFEDKISKKTKNLFTDIIASISDFQFLKDQQLVTRDYLSIKTWDIRKQNEPIKNIQLYESMTSKLYDVYEKDHIFDKFSLAISGDKGMIATGFYNNYFHMLDIYSGQNMMYELNFNKKTICKNISPGYNEPISNNFDFNKKVIKLAWNPKHSCLVLSSLNCLFIYNGI